MPVSVHSRWVAKLIVSSIGFVAVIATTSFYAGQMNQRMTSQEGALLSHVTTECHGQICVRVAVLENQVARMAMSIEALVGAINSERTRNENEP